MDTATAISNTLSFCVQHQEGTHTRDRHLGVEAEEVMAGFRGEEEVEEVLLDTPVEDHEDRLISEDPGGVEVTGAEVSRTLCCNLVHVFAFSG